MYFNCYLRDDMMRMNRALEKSKKEEKREKLIQHLLEQLD